MSFSDAGELALIKYILQGVQPSWDVASNLFVSLHTADPGETGNQATSEASYTGYSRVTVSRTFGTGGFTTSSTTKGDNLAAIAFPACGGGSATVTHVGLGTDFSGNGTLLISGALTASLAVSSGITPSFDTSSLTLSLD
jgi:hypothetical protein